MLYLVKNSVSLARSALLHDIHCILYWIRFANLQICNYAQKPRICRENSKYAPHGKVFDHCCPRRKVANFWHPGCTFLYRNWKKLSHPTEVLTFFSLWDFFYFWCGGGLKNITLYVRRFPRWRHPGWVASHCSTHLWETHDGISSSALQTNPIFTKLRFRRNPKSRTHLFLFPPLDANQGRPDVFSILEHEAGPWR